MDSWRRRGDRAYQGRVSQPCSGSDMQAFKHSIQPMYVLYKTSCLGSYSFLFEVYSDGQSEIILGKAIKQLNLPRDEIVVMTKVMQCILMTCVTQC